ncbi:hypothetical protein EC919_104165 [Pseudomonas graminis]|uniref:hypothetical protein n=1 Tax=Pseudomonas graminis TaxID=158627 RepID=UPI00105E5D3A|nr:hypothetical protein [Pseudomonas graminis]TDV54429.1 hypothetical protein EC919_104165 [Pseudomonas graminis]
MTLIKERPILFAAPMVRAILEGRKTVTRREVKKQAALDCLAAGFEPAFLALPGNSDLCPQGRPGDRLWVRETTEMDEQTSDSVALTRYAVDGEPVLYSGCADPEYNGTVAHWDYPRRSRPSIHMHRWASRIVLEITDVRVERLQAISRSDIRAEGLECPPELASDDVSPNYRDWYPAAWRDLWESINGAGAWEANPWVWVVEFKRVMP